MKLEGIQEEDLVEIYLTEFPDFKPIDECRDSLEMMIAEVYEEDFDGCEDCDLPEMSITPYWIFRAMSNKHRGEFEKMSEDQKKKTIAWCLDEREKRRKEYVALLDKPQ